MPIKLIPTGATASSLCACGTLLRRKSGCALPRVAGGEPFALGTPQSRYQYGRGLLFLDPGSGPRISPSQVFPAHSFRPSDPVRGIFLAILLLPCTRLLHLGATGGMTCRRSRPCSPAFSFRARRFGRRLFEALRHPGGGDDWHCVLGSSSRWPFAEVCRRGWPAIAQRFQFHPTPVSFHQPLVAFFDGALGRLCRIHNEQ